MKYPTPEAFAAKVAPGEPVFLLRAQDVLAVHAVLAYAAVLDSVGLTRQSNEVAAVAVDFAAWARANPDRTKMPD